MSRSEQMGVPYASVPDDGGPLTTLTRAELLAARNGTEREPPAETSAQANHCPGCGAELAPAKGHRERKWCSDLCRNRAVRERQRSGGGAVAASTPRKRRAPVSRAKKRPAQTQTPAVADDPPALVVSALTDLFDLADADELTLRANGHTLVVMRSQ